MTTIYMVLYCGTVYCLPLQGCLSNYVIHEHYIMTTISPYNWPLSPQYLYNWTSWSLYLPVGGIVIMMFSCGEILWSWCSVVRRYWGHDVLLLPMEGILEGSETNS